MRTSGTDRTVRPRRQSTRCGASFPGLRSGTPSIRGPSPLSMHGHTPNEPVARFTGRWETQHPNASNAIDLARSGERNWSPARIDLRMPSVAEKWIRTARESVFQPLSRLPMIAEGRRGRQFGERQGTKEALATDAGSIPNCWLSCRRIHRALALLLPSMRAIPSKSCLPHSITRTATAARLP